MHPNLACPHKRKIRCLRHPYLNCRHNPKHVWIFVYLYQSVKNDFCQSLCRTIRSRQSWSNLIKVNFGPDLSRYRSWLVQVLTGPGPDWSRSWFLGHLDPGGLGPWLIYIGLGWSRSWLVLKSNHRPGIHQSLFSRGRFKCWLPGTIIAPCVLVLKLNNCFFFIK
jgi:hypothetical protein